MVNVEKLNKDIDGFGKVVDRINKLPDCFEKLDESSSTTQQLLKQSTELIEEQKSIPKVMENQLKSTDGEIKKIKELVLEDGKTIQTLRSDLIDQTKKLDDANKTSEALAKDIESLKGEVDAVKTVLIGIEKTTNLIKMIAFGSLGGVVLCAVLLFMMMR